jgi:hypothetical protein
VALLKAEVDRIKAMDLENRHGYIKILPGRDHGSVVMTPDMQAIPREMREHLVRNGHIEKGGAP